MTRRMRNGLLAAVALTLWAGAAAAEMRLNFQPQQTELGHAIYNLHTIVLLICVVIFVGVFGAMFYSIVYHRKSVGHKAAHFHENTTVELVWTVVPFLILVGMAYPATKTLLEQRDTSAPDISIKVTGYQWKWHYDYLQEGVSFYSKLSTPQAQIQNLEPKGEHYLLEVDNPMVVPVGKKVRVLITAGDVLHAWYVPALAVKQDAIPGLHPRRLVQRRQCRHLSRPVRGAVRQGARLHAHRGARGDRGRVQAVAGGAEGQAAGRQQAARRRRRQVAAAEPAVAHAPRQPAPPTARASTTRPARCATRRGWRARPSSVTRRPGRPRIAQGEATLRDHAINGIRTMPAKGGNVGAVRCAGGRGGRRTW